jgi:hypothetical protein
MVAKRKKCEFCGSYLANDHREERFCSPCSDKLRGLDLIEQDGSPRYYTVEEYAREHRMEAEQVRRKCRSKEIIAMKPGRRWLIPRRRVELAMPLGTDRGLSSAMDLVSSFEDSYPIKEVMGDITELPLTEVISKAMARLPSPAHVVKHAMRVSRNLPPPNEFLRGIKAYLGEEKPR